MRLNAFHVQEVVSFPPESAPCASLRWVSTLLMRWHQLRAQLQEPACVGKSFKGNVHPSKRPSLENSFKGF